MGIRVIRRGALSGFVAGVLGFIFTRIFAEPVINQAIAYESGRDSILAELNKGRGRVVAPDGPEIFSRSIQSTIGIATGIIAFSRPRWGPWSPWPTWSCTAASVSGRPPWSR